MGVSAWPLEFGAAVGTVGPARFVHVRVAANVRPRDVHLLAAGLGTDSAETGAGAAFGGLDGSALEGCHEGQGDFGDGWDVHFVLLFVLKGFCLRARVSEV